MPFIIIPIFVFSGILIVGGVLEERESFGPLFHNLCDKYNVDCSSEEQGNS